MQDMLERALPLLLQIKEEAILPLPQYTGKLFYHHHSTYTSQSGINMPNQFGITMPSQFDVTAEFDSRTKGLRFEHHLSQLSHFILARKSIGIAEWPSSLRMLTGAETASTVHFQSRLEARPKPFDHKTDYVVFCTL